MVSRGDPEANRDEGRRAWADVPGRAPASLGDLARVRHVRYADRLHDRREGVIEADVAIGVDAILALAAGPTVTGPRIPAARRSVMPVSILASWTWCYAARVRSLRMAKLDVSASEREELINGQAV